MNRKLVAGLAAAGLLAGGGTAAALAMAGGTAPAAAASVAAVSHTRCPGPAGSPLWSLVAKGTITQAQAAAVHSALRADMSSRWLDMHTGGLTGIRSHLTTALQALVQDGTITQAQATAIVNAMITQMQEHWGHGPGPNGPGPGMMGASQLGWAN